MKRELLHEVMNLVDRIKQWGSDAKKDYERLCQERGIEDSLFSFELTEKHLEVAKEVQKLWQTTNKFKVGDKVYVVPLTHTMSKNCIRATVTEVGMDGWGYRLRAFEQDLPGIFMFNIWDKDLQPRVGKANRPTPKELLIK